ncbi:MAG: hypothetical protein IM591_13755, partial [Chitinophagaceae bacterium]|nr:hypothetical protein [Chitinophagaceae bacterium]
MDEKQLKALWESMSATHELGNFDAFKKNIYSDSNFRKNFWEEAAPLYEIGDYKTFEESFKKKVSPLQAPSPSSATPSFSQYKEQGYKQLEKDTSIFNPELSDFQKYEQSLSRKATAYNWANSPTKAAAEPRVAGNPVAAILNMFSPDKMAESYGAIGKDIEKRENIRQNAEVEYKKYEEESNNYAKSLLPTIKETVSQYSGKLNKNGVPDYGKISQLSRQLSSQLGGGDYVSEVIRGQLENQERFAIIEPNVKKEYEKIVKKEKGLSFWLNVQPTERKKIENSLIQKQLVTAQKIKQAETLASTEYKKTELEATERYKPLIAAAQINGNEEELNGIVNQYYTEMKGIAAKINNRVKRTRDELVNQFNSEIQKAQLPESEVKYLNDTYQKAYSNVVKGDLEAKKIIQQKEEKLIGYTGIFGKSLLSGLLSGISNRGSGLVGIGLGGSLSDFLYSFKSGAEIAETVDLDFKGNMFNPTTYLTRLGKQVGYQLPSMVVTALTKNPTIGGMVGFVDEQLQNGGDVYEQILSETGDPVKAQQATARYWYRSLPTIPLYYLESSMFLKYTGLKKGNVLANVVAEVPVEVTQELIQGYSQQLDTKDALGFKDFMSQKAPNIALETAITTLLQGGSFAALGKLGSALGNQNELGKNYIYNLLNSKGTNAAFAMLELQQLNGQITEEQLLLGKENLAKVASTITELKAVGLNDTQVEGYLALLAERDGLRENLTKTSNPELISAYQKEIESLNKELEQAALGKVKATTVEFTSGGKITLLGDPKSVLSSTKKEVGNTINITSTDDSVNKEVQDINSKIPQQENEELSNKIIDLQVDLAEVGVFPLDQDGMLTFTDQEGNQIEEQALPQEALELKEVYDRLNGNAVPAQEVKPNEKQISPALRYLENGVSIEPDNTSEGFYKVYKDEKLVGLLGATDFVQSKNKGQYFDENLMSEILTQLGIEHGKAERNIQGENDFLTIRTKGGSSSLKAVESLLSKEQTQPTETKTKEELEIEEKQKKEVEETASKLKAKGLFKTDESKGIGKLVPKKFYDKKKSAFQIVSEAYNEAKRDKSNPELVKAVNDFLDEESGRLPKDLKGRRVGNKKYAAGKDHIKGRTITKRTPTGQKVKGTYKLVPAAQLVPSHNPISFSKNEAFPQNESGKTINDRDYEKNEADKTAVIGFAQNLDGRAVENTPWVSKEGIVYNGNNRTMSRQLAAKNNTDKEYLNQLKEQAEMYGFTEEQVESMENPTLVFEVEQNLPFITKVWKMFNAEEKKEETPGAFAIAISKTISDKARRELSKLYEEAEVPSDVTSDKKMFKRALDILVQDGVIQAIEIPKYSDNGTATPEGVALLERVVLGASLDENAIETLMSLSMGNIKNAILKNIVGLMLNSTKGGNSLIPDITGAIAILKKAKVLKSSVLDFLVAFDIFDENQWTLSEMALALLLDLNSPNKLKEFLSAYNQDVGQQLMFGDSTKEGIITNLIYNIIPEHEKGKKVIERVAERGTDETGKGTESPNRKDEEKEQLMTGKVPNRISKKAFDKLVEKLQKAFPKAKITFNANDVKGKAATEIKTKGGIIYGATLPDGTIYLNREAMSAEAPIHEFTHLWERLMPEDWKNGLEFFKKSSGFAKALKEIKDNPAYKSLTQKQKESEAMNTILGRMGEGYFSSDMLTKFKNWFTQLLKKVADKLNLRKLTPDEKFESFANKVLGDLFGGKELTNKKVINKFNDLFKLIGKEFKILNDIKLSKYPSFSAQGFLSLEDKTKLYKKAFGETVAKIIRAKMPIAFDYQEKLIDYIKKVIPVKSSMPFILQNLANVIEEQFIKQLGSISENIEKINQDPIKLLNSVGYELGKIDNEEDAMSFRGYYPGTDDNIGGSVICTYRDVKGRIKNNIVLFIVKDDAKKTLKPNELTQENLSESWKTYLEKLGRKKEDGTYDLKNLKNNREDPYSTSVLSIQINKNNGYLKIISRYNHTIQEGSSNPDATFNNDLNKIVVGLEDSLYNYFNLKNSKNKNIALPDGVVQDSKGNYYNYYEEVNGIYYGQTFYIENGNATFIDTNSEKIIDGYLIKNNGIAKKIASDNDEFVFGEIKKVSFLSNDKISMETTNGNVLFNVSNGKITKIESIDISLSDYVANKYYKYDKENNSIENVRNYYQQKYLHIIFGNLTTIGEDAYFENSQVTNLGNLTTIGESAYFENSQVTNLGNLTTIGGNAVFEDSQVTNLGNLTTIGESALFGNSQVTNL